VASQDPPVERSPAHWLSFERLLAEISARFVNLSPTQVDPAIVQSLRQVVEALGVDRSSVGEFSEDRRALITTHQWARDGGPRDTERDVTEAATWYTKTLLAGTTISITHPADLPEHAVYERAYCAATGIHAHLAIPLPMAGRPLAVLGVACFERRRVWEAELIPRLRLLGEVFANAVDRRNQATSVERALDEVRQLKGRLETENRYLRRDIDASERPRGGIVGESPAIKRVLAQAAQVADTGATVLLLGERGTGKELVARTIHGASSRRERLLVQANCVALPATLLETELFGRERGAYTGALARQMGRFEVADGSAIFLDEIGALPLELQAKLLHLLERGELERQGSSRTIRVDVRVIAATNHDLVAMVEQGTFREDLYHRLNVFSITVPPLRTRHGDVPLLVWAFVRELAQTQGKTFEQIPKPTMDALQRYAWPGNVRELRNVIERAVILNPGPTLHVDLPAPTAGATTTDGSLNTASRRHITKVLDDVSWRIRGRGGAAERLGLKPSTLESRMRKLGIKR